MSQYTTITLSEAISRTGSTAATLLGVFPESAIYLDESVVELWIEELKEIREKHVERNLAILERNRQREQQEEPK